MKKIQKTVDKKESLWYYKWVVGNQCELPDDLRKCRNWQTSKTKDLVSIALVWVQVPSSALSVKALSHAGMAELADAQASGACGSNVVRVQVPFPALQKGSFWRQKLPFLCGKPKRFRAKLTLCMAICRVEKRTDNRQEENIVKKLAVLFPGIGYTTDRPLLYYAGKLAEQNGF